MHTERVCFTLNFGERSEPEIFIYHGPRKGFWVTKNQPYWKVARFGDHFLGEILEEIIKFP